MIRLPECVPEDDRDCFFSDEESRQYAEQQIAVAVSRVIRRAVQSGRLRIEGSTWRKAYDGALLYAASNPKASPEECAKHCL